ncbi:MAG: bifunctional nuclease family protein [Bryobacterales bacterium]|nr:bifunctional nuclease family protein [Bryobacterales bacterium]
MQEIEMRICGLMMDPITNMPIVVLKDLANETVLPIWIGVYEANAIALEIEKASTPRPMTHDLVRNILHTFKAELRRIVVTELRDDTFFAVLWVEREGQLFGIDSRPSDALALALRMDCGIWVTDNVIQSSKVSPTLKERTSSEDLRRWLENLGEEDLGQYKM